VWAAEPPKRASRCRILRRDAGRVSIGSAAKEQEGCSQGSLLRAFPGVPLAAPYPTGMAQKGPTPMSSWQAICDLLKYAIGERARTPRLVMLVTALVLAVIVLLSAIALLAGPHAR
jgi:hypothetical protein